MRKIIVCIPILLTLSLTAQIRVDCSGYYPTVGIGTNPQPNFYLTTSSRVKFDLGSYVGLIIDPSAYYALALYPTTNNHGNIGRSDRAFREIWAYNYYDLNSDSSQKENIRSLTNALQIVKGLRGIKYDLKREVAMDKTITDAGYVANVEKSRKGRVGFVAQEMVKVFPEAVHYVDSTHVYGIDYTRVIPVLVEAIKEQQIIIEALQKELDNFKKANSGNLKSASLPTAVGNTGGGSQIVLYQNNPNPFTQNTTISYYLPEHVGSAMICIYDMNGSQLKCYSLYQKGNSSIVVAGNELKAGIYIYSLPASQRSSDETKVSI